MTKVFRMRDVLMTKTSYETKDHTSRNQSSLKSAILAKQRSSITSFFAYSRTVQGFKVKIKVPRLKIFNILNDQHLKDERFLLIKMETHQKKLR